MTNNDKLTQLKVDLVSAIRDWRSKWELLQQRLTNAQNWPQSRADREKVVDEALAEPSARITMCSEAILQLTDDKRAEALVSKLDGLISAEIRFWRGATQVGAAIPDAVKSSPAYQLIGKLIAPLVVLPAAVRHKEVVATMAEAEAYFSSAA